MINRMDGKKRKEILTEFGANVQEVRELLAYNENVFKYPHDQDFPLEDELFVTTWKNYEQEAKKTSIFAVLKEKLVQLQFPIQRGISRKEFYRCATLRGVRMEGKVEATGLILDHPERLDLEIHQTAAGCIPILTVRERNDFVTLVQALTKRNEPIPILAAMGACMIAGYNNWDRIWRYRREWERKRKAEKLDQDWQAEFKALIPNKALYQDCFMILSDGAYSGVAAADLQLPSDEWRELSLIIRREHEATHYFTQRVLGSMQNNMLDELIADYIGIISAVGEYRAAWFLRFIGLQNAPDCRVDGRIHAYRGSLSDGAFLILQKLIIQAAFNLEKWNNHFQGKPITEQKKAQMIQMLAQFTLEELASAEGMTRLAKVHWQST